MTAPVTPIVRKERRTLYTLVVDNYAPDIIAMTIPLMATWAAKVGAELAVMTERRFPDWPVQCEKFQIPEHAARRNDEWSMFLDADTLLHPDYPDIFEYLDRGTIYHDRVECSTTRYEPDRYFRRDGRYLSPGNWCCIASEWTRDDLYSFPPELSRAEVEARIHPHVNELALGVRAPGLIDDYLMARNAARFGLKRLMLDSLLKPLLLNNVMWHNYLLTDTQKVVEMHKTLKLWGLE
jgi:hypothetical protein